MIKKYLVLSHWTDKKTGVAMATLGEVNEGLSKEGKAKDQPYGIAETKNTLMVEGEYALGSLVAFNMTPVEQKQESQAGFKINPKQEK